MPARRRAVDARRQRALGPEPEPEPQPPEQVAERPQRRGSRSGGGGVDRSESHDDEQLVRQVARAVALEEKGRLQEALALYEPAYVAYQEARRPRPKLLRRIIEVKRRFAVEEELGMVVQGDASRVDPEASERRMRARRKDEREREQLHAVLRIQANFRSRKVRRELAQRRSEDAERFLDSSSSVGGDVLSVVDAFASAARRGRLRTQEEIKFMERTAAAREQELKAEAARAARAEAEADALRTQLEFFRQAQPELAEFMVDEAGRAEMSAGLNAGLGVLHDAAREAREAGETTVPWTELCRTAPMQVRFNTLLVQLTGRGAASTAVRVSLLREPDISVADNMTEGPIVGTGWSRWLDAAGEPFFLLQGHHPTEEDTGGGIFTALFEYPQQEEEATAIADGDDGPLTMSPGDVVEVVERSDPDWWFGTLRDAPERGRGYFPAAWVLPYGAQRKAPAEVLVALGATVERAEVYSNIPKIEAIEPAAAAAAGGARAAGGGGTSPGGGGGGRRSAGDRSPRRPLPVFGARLDSEHPLMEDGCILPGCVCMYG